MSMNFLEVLVDPPHADIDIVAVHGLNPFKKESNARSTWTAESREGKHFWLQDKEFLPSWVPKARILLCGYNSSVALASSNADINNHATNVLFLLRQRRKECLKRPLLFICHSLGGLLIKRALVIAFSNGVEKDKILYESTYGIVFFATPHGGGEHVKFGKILSSIAGAVLGAASNDILDALKKNDFYSNQNRSDFIPRTRDFHFVSFFETKDTRGVKVVDKENAVLHLRPDQETVFGVDGDHLSICQFSAPKGLDFEIVATSIAELCTEAIDQSKEPGKALGSPSPEQIMPTILPPGETSPNLGEPLLHAATSGNVDIAELLLEKGAPLEVEDNDGKTPLARAAMHGHAGIVHLLLEKGARVDHADKSGKTPLVLAIQMRREEVVRLLLEKGAHPDSTGKGGWIPLSCAAVSGSVDIVELILEKGAPLEREDSNGKTPLAQAAMHGHAGIVHLLLEKGARVDHADKSGKTPLVLAIQMRREEVVRLMLR